MISYMGFASVLSEILFSVHDSKAKIREDFSSIVKISVNLVKVKSIFSVYRYNSMFAAMNAK